jgi:hypothetical protein
MKHSFKPGKFQPVVDVRKYDDPLEDNFMALDSDLNARFVAVDSHIVEFLRPVKPNIQVGDNLFDHIDLDLLPENYSWEYPGYDSESQHSIFSNNSFSSASSEDMNDVSSDDVPKMVHDLPAATLMGSTSDVSLNTDFPLHSNCVSQEEHTRMYSMLSHKVDTLLRVLSATVGSVNDLAKVKCVDSKLSRSIQRSTVIDAVTLRHMSDLEVVDFTED